MGRNYPNHQPLSPTSIHHFFSMLSAFAPLLSPILFQPPPRINVKTSSASSDFDTSVLPGSPHISQFKVCESLVILRRESGVLSSLVAKAVSIAPILGIHSTQSVSTFVLRRRHHDCSCCWQSHSALIAQAIDGDRSLLRDIRPATGNIFRNWRVCCFLQRSSTLTPPLSQTSASVFHRKHKSGISIPAANYLR